ncbi:MAG: DUF3034 family protein [Deltaproteobacteria bacterium]|nr:DUF3034 family protein [Deltaproteobacteria bacterium]
MMKKCYHALPVFSMFLVSFIFLVTRSAIAGPPVVNIEGEGGGGLVPWAYLTNPPADGQLFGNPSVGSTYIFPQNFNVNVYHFNETISDRLELGFARTVFDTTNILGGNGLNIGIDELTIDTYHAKVLLLKETDTLPAVSVSIEYKKNQDIAHADKNGGGAFTSTGMDDDSGLDYCLSVTKLYKGWKMPVLINLSGRYTKAAQTGYLGFSKNGNFEPEASLAVLPESNVAVGVEFRGKPNEYKSVAGIGSFQEDNWTDFFIAYFPTKGLSITGAVVNFGNIVNRNVNTGLYMNMKYDF